MGIVDTIENFMSTNFIQNYSPACDISIVILSIVLLLTLRESFACSSYAFRIFIGIFGFVILASCSNVAIYTGFCLQMPTAFLILFRSLYRISMILIMEIFVYYIYKLIGLKKRKLIIFSLVFSSVMGLLDILLPVLGLAKYDDPFTIPFFLVYLHSIVFGIYLFNRHRNKIIKQLRSTLIFSEAIAILLIVIESFFRLNTFMTFSFLLPILAVLFLAYANPYNLDTGALGMNSFESYLKEKMTKKNCFFCIQFIAEENFYLTREMGICLREFWKHHFEDAVMFNPISNFVVFASEKGMERQKICESGKVISDQLGIDCKQLLLPAVSFCRSFNEFYKVFDFLTSDTESNTIKICYPEDLEKLHRHHIIEEHLQDIYIRPTACRMKECLCFVSPSGICRRESMILQRH